MILSASDRCNRITPQDLAQTLLDFSSLRSMNSGRDLMQLVELLTLTSGQQDQCNLYGLISQMIRSWASKTDDSGIDGDIIRDCREICHHLGWAPINRVCA